jgi:hypothetical protein
MSKLHIMSIAAPSAHVCITLLGSSLLTRIASNANAALETSAFLNASAMRLAPSARRAAPARRRSAGQRSAHALPTNQNVIPRSAKIASTIRRGNAKITRLWMAHSRR